MILLALVIAGIVILMRGHSISSGQVMLKVGAAMIMLVWVLLFLWIFGSFDSNEFKKLLLPFGGGPVGMLVQSFASAKRHDESDTAIRLSIAGSRVS